MPPVAAKKRPAQPVIQEAPLPAPMGGLNAASAASAVPGTDCMRLWNMIASEHGLRVRLGEREWVTGLTGLADDQVRTTIAYSGSAADDSKDRLFVTTSTGIFDVSASTETPGAAAVTFGTQTGDAGRGIHHAFVTAGGHFLLYCDEENGLFIYTESTDTWAQVVVGTTMEWEAQQTYFIGNRVISDGSEWVCDTDGVSDASAGPTGNSADTVDGTTQWDYVGAAPSNVIGPDLVAQQLSLTADPANFVFGGVFKGRLWFVEKDSARAWYLEAGSVYGTATHFNLATQFKAGGYLVGLWNWTRDGGAGMDDSLVAISSGGDVAIYQGTDPSNINFFGLKGTWNIGATPQGRRIATGFGGDVLLLSRAGLIPVSTLEKSTGVDAGQYATAKIGPLFNQLMIERADMDGWAVHLHPEENALFILMPTVEGQETEQLAMSLTTKSWSRMRGLPMFSADTWQGKLYFGTADGRVEINDGYTDGRTLADADAYEEVEWALTTAFSNFGNARKKQFKMCRTTFLSDGGSPRYKIAARYKYDFNEAGAPDAVAPSGSGWDIGEWDEAVWGGEFGSTQELRGLSGMGFEAALALSGKSAIKTVLVNFDVFYVQGGAL